MDSTLIYPVFPAALLEAVPFVGIFFTISNRIGACMWAFDLEKRQHRFASGELKPLAPRVIQVPGPGVDSNTEIELPPRTEASILNTQENSDKFMRQRPLGVAGGDEKEHMAGEWTT